MEAKWGGTCPKCSTTYVAGDSIKAQFVRGGYDPDTGKIKWVRVPKAYVHAPRCPKVTPNKPGHRTVDPLTGEILDVSPIPRHHEQLGML